MASVAPTLLSDGNLQLEPAPSGADPGTWRWQVNRPPGQQILGSVELQEDRVPGRRILMIEMPEDAPAGDLTTMAEAVRLACRWAFASADVRTVAWIGPTSQTLRSVVHQAGLRVHPLPQRGGWPGPKGAVDAWYADLTAADPAIPEGPSLTTREQHVLAHMARGRSNAEIAERLAISENTVKNHVRAILENLQAPSRTAAVITALQTGLVSLETVGERRRTR